MRRTVRFFVAALALGALATVSIAADAPPSPDQAVLNHLNEMAAWYGRVATFEQGSGGPTEVLLRDAVQRSSRQALDLTFEYARAEAARLNGPPQPTLAPTTSPTTSPTTAPARAAAAPVAGSQPSRGQRLAQAAAAADQRAAQLQADLDQLGRQIAAAAPAELPDLTARRDRTAAELNLVTARRDVLRNLVQMSTSPANGAGDGLLEKIDAIQRSIPAAAGQEAAAGSPGAASATAAGAAAGAAVAGAAVDTMHAESGGVLGVMTRLLDLSRRMRELKALADQAENLRQASDRLRAPIREELMNAVRQADAAAPAAESQQPQQLERQRRELDALATRFKQLSASAVPLGRQSVLLDQARASLLDWRAVLGRQYMAALRGALIRLAITGAVVGAIFVFSALWRRATFRYVHDARRRRQFMLIRRLVVGCALVVVGLFSFVTEFGSLATFAGILTAGIAVSLQTLILSGVAYFFFVGRFGVRVGDRVTVGGVTGDVIETGLFRLYLMELGGARRLDPTGRVVVLANSVLFQPSGFYKQVPGADYVWHELALTLAPDSDHQLAEKRLMGAAQSVFAKYQDQIDRQHAAARHSGAVPAPPPRPVGRLRFVASGLEFTLRYPVEIASAADVEDRLTRKLLAAIEEEPKLRLVPSDTPVIQAAAP